jgi:hypothetical protein
LKAPVSTGANSSLMTEGADFGGLGHCRQFSKSPRDDPRQGRMWAVFGGGEPGDALVRVGGLPYPAISAHSLHYAVWPAVSVP